MMISPRFRGLLVAQGILARAKQRLSVSLVGEKWPPDGLTTLHHAEEYVFQQIGEEIRRKATAQAPRVLSLEFLLAQIVSFCGSAGLPPNRVSEYHLSDYIDRARRFLGVTSAQEAGRLAGKFREEFPNFMPERSPLWAPPYFDSSPSVSAETEQRKP